MNFYWCTITGLCDLLVAPPDSKGPIRHITNFKVLQVVTYEKTQFKS